MLLETVHMPGIYSEVPEDPRAARMYCSLLVNLLLEARENCVVLLDEGGTMLDQIRRGLRHWPEKYRHKGQELLKKLDKGNRLVRVEAGNTSDKDSDRAGCRMAVAIASREKPDIVVSSRECDICSPMVIDGTQRVDLDEYAISRFAGIRRNRVRLELADGEWGREEFDAEVWHRIFRHAKHVKVLDRMIGGHLHEQARHGNELKVNPNYSRSLEWIFERWAAVTAGHPTRSFEITCALDPNRIDVALGAKILRQFGQQLSAKYGVSVLMKVKKELRSAKMRHARFIFTDQVALLVERGFDLLRDDGRVRDVMITHVSTRGAIEKELGLLDDVP